MIINLTVKEFEMERLMEIETSSDAGVVFTKIKNNCLSVLTEGLRLLPESIKIGIVMKLLNKMQFFICDYVNGKFKENNILAVCKSIKFTPDEEEENKMTIKIDLDSVDYDEIVAVALPMALNYVNSKEELRPVQSVINILGDDLDIIINNIFSLVAPEKKDEIVKSFLDDYQNQIIETINARLNGIINLTDYTIIF
ncbi:MAG: hypothetical protein LUF92_16490 [Clostridiales bacterium]|nr:hypothetical protein [Clostridiales bacterium]